MLRHKTEDKVLETLEKLFNCFQRKSVFHDGSRHTRDITLWPVPQIAERMGEEVQDKQGKTKKLLLWTVCR